MSRAIIAVALASAALRMVGRGEPLPPLKTKPQRKPHEQSESLKRMLGKTKRRKG